MPALLAPIAAKAIGVFSAAVWEGIITVAAVAGSYAYSRNAQKKAMRSISSIDGRMVTARDPVAARPIIYGQARVGGTIVFAASSGTSNEYLHLVIALAGHEVEEIGDIYFNDECALTGPGSAAIGSFAGYADIYKKLGSDTQTVETNLQAAVGSGVWSNDHRLRGIAYIYVRLKHNPDVYATGIPNITAIVKGRKVYDPRTTTTAWSANSALCLRDYLTDTRYGLGMLAAEINDTAINAAANICDEDVALAAGGTEDRYKTNGVIYSDEVCGTVIDSLVAAMAGSLFFSGGRWTALAGAHVTPTLTFTEDDIRGAVVIQTKDSRRDTCNRVRGTYIASSQQWQPVDFPPVVNATYKSEDGGEDLWRDLVLGFTTSDTAAQRLAKIELEKSRQDITVSAPMKATALTCQCGDVVQLTLARYGWTAKQFEVVTAQIVIDTSGEIGMDLTLRETASGIWDWSAEETAVDLAPNTTLPDPYTVPTPTGLTLSSGSGVATQQPDGTILNRLKVAWTAPARSFVTNGGRVWIEYKPSAAADWITWANDIRGDQTADYITDVKVGVNYDVRVRFENVWGVRGDYAESLAHTIAAWAITPSDPTAATKTSEGVYTGTDGSVYAYMTFSLPALPAGAAKQFLVYKRSTDTDWIIASGTYAGAATVTIIDLTPGVIYAVATLAVSSLDIPSNYVAATSSPFTAPSKTTGPGDVSAFSVVAGNSSDYREAPIFSGAVLFYCAKLSFTPPADKDIDYYEVMMRTSTNPVAGTLIGEVKKTSVPSIAMGQGLVFNPTYFHVRAVNKTGIAGSWYTDSVSYHGSFLAPAGDSVSKNVGTTAGTVAAGDDSRITGAAQKSSNLSDLSSAATARSNLGLGTIATQAANSVALTGGYATDVAIAAAAASSKRALKCVYPTTVVENLTNSTTYTFAVTITNCGFAAKPQVGLLGCASSDDIIGRYDYDSSSTDYAYFVVSKKDGSSLSSGNQRFSILLVGY